MTNHLSHETSPYLLQHQDNPVDWYPWGKEALDRARIEDKPIFLSIGYSACHWCHVMAHESFEDQEIAQFLNRNFISIKVDREERPDLDSIYMAAVVALTGQGGWPMTLFLNPDGKPFYGGTYFPPQPRHGIPSFREVLIGIEKTWRDDRGQIDQVAQKLTVQIRQNGIRSQDKYELAPETANLALNQLITRYDWINGGWGKAPKFPQPMAIEFVLSQAARGNKDVLKLVNHVLTAMSRGGMYDVVGGGFHRYSTDDQWLIPHFEKMLYDNALLGQVYLHAFLLTGEVKYREICTEILDFIKRELMDPSGGFYSSLDADLEGEEGKPYLWSTKEIREVLTEPNQYNLFSTAYNLHGAGNFEEKWVLQQQMDDAALSKKFNLQPSEIHQQLHAALHQLLASRQTRRKSGTDDKVLAFWNALTLTTFAEAGQYLQREDYLDIARKNASFILDNLLTDGRLHRSWRQGIAKHNAFLEDYAGVILGLISLYQVDPEPRWFQAAYSLAKEMVSHFKDTTGGFFDTRDDHDPLIIRPKEYQDNATPSGNSLAAMALLKLSEFIPEQTAWHEIAIQQLSRFQEVAVQYPTAFSHWLITMDFAIHPIRQVAILRSTDDTEYFRMMEVVYKTFRPNTVVAVASFPPHPESAPILLDKPLLNQQTTAYLCEGFTCKQPVTTSTELEKQLSRM